MFTKRDRLQDVALLKQIETNIPVPLKVDRVKYGYTAIVANLLHDTLKERMIKLGVNCEYNPITQETTLKWAKTHTTFSWLQVVDGAIVVTCVCIIGCIIMYNWN